LGERRRDHGLAAGAAGDGEFRRRLRAAGLTAVRKASQVDRSGCPIALSAPLARPAGPPRNP
jgi:hypothetical protein